ncbi:unnamed protein product [Staurois parvus]|uniref:Uncharacterized protein n=1 Tax=Staurois parvus TaxID=386267 RepID=A0ABN9GBH6_9NEOB|nr:unnamed protein product [Staurois parvus]
MVNCVLCVFHIMCCVCFTMDTCCFVFLCCAEKYKAAYTGLSPVSFPR